MEGRNGLYYPTDNLSDDGSLQLPPIMNNATPATVDFTSGSEGTEDFDTVSLTESVTSYEYENGRRYHGYRAGKYLVPNDEMQNNQLDIFNHLYTLALDGGLHTAPLVKPRRILDIGTGTGIWANEIADMYPEATVIGTDLSPTQTDWVNPNVNFFVEDAEDDWVFDEKFDYIHIRCLFMAIRDWASLIERCFRNLEPGGWLEIVELEMPYHFEDPEFGKTTKIYEWCRAVADTTKTAGHPLEITGDIQRWMNDAGFQHTRDRIIKIPMGPWPRDKKGKERGYWMLTGTLEGLEGWTSRVFTDLLGWQPLETQVFHAAVRSEMKDSKRIRSSVPFHHFIGQKPDQESLQPRAPSIPPRTSSAASSSQTSTQR